MTAKLHHCHVPGEATREQKFEFLRTHTLLPWTPERQTAAAEEAAHRIPTRRVHPVRRPSKHIRAAAEGYQRAYQVCRTMSRANPGHAALPALEKRLEEAREALFAALRYEDRHDRRVYLVKWGM